jgi:DNA-binding NarL/FixJ family response regulator
MRRPAHPTGRNRTPDVVAPSGQIVRPASSERTRVAAVDRSALIREGLSAILGAQPGIELVGVCADRQELDRLLARQWLDVIVTDLSTLLVADDEDDAVVIARLHGEDAGVGLVVLTQRVELDVVGELLGAGCSGRAYLLKDRIADATELVQAIAAVHEGGSAIDPAVVEALIHAREHETRSPLTQLTPREREILGRIAKGESNGAIAESCALTKRSVEKHVNSIFAKLSLRDSAHVSRRVKAALLFLADDRDA